MPQDPFIREKFTKNLNAARKHAAEYFRRFPKDRYRTDGITDLSALRQRRRNESTLPRLNPYSLCGKIAHVLGTPV